MNSPQTPEYIKKLSDTFCEQYEKCYRGVMAGKRCDHDLFNDLTTSEANFVGKGVFLYDYYLFSQKENPKLIFKK